MDVFVCYVVFVLSLWHALCIRFSPTVLETDGEQRKTLCSHGAHSLAGMKERLGAVDGEQMSVRPEERNESEVDVDGCREARKP